MKFQEDSKIIFDTAEDLVKCKKMPFKTQTYERGDPQISLIPSFSDYSDEECNCADTPYGCEF